MPRIIRSGTIYWPAYKLDYKKLLEEDPICIKDKLFSDKDLVITDLASTTKYLGIHKELNEKYKLYEVADADSDFENVTTEYEDKFMSYGMKIYRCEAKKRK